MSMLRTWRLVVLLAGGMSAAAFADHREDPGSKRPYVLALDALVGPTGTDVALRVSAPGGQALPDEAENVLLWSTTRHGRVGWIRHFRDLPLADGAGTIPGLEIAEHTRLSAIVEVRVAGSRRIQVLLGSAVALGLPDLRISGVNAPATVSVGQTVNIDVLVQEVRGRRGATFDVELLEGGTLLDSVTGASVDATGSVSALFSVRFMDAGTHALTARIVNAMPVEYDTTNNSASFEIRAGDLASVSYSMDYQRIEGEFSDNFQISTNETRETPDGTETRITDRQNQYQEIGRHETLNYFASSDRFVSGGVDLVVMLRIDGAQQVALAIAGWLPFDSKSGSDFASNAYQMYDPDTNAYAYLESFWSPKGVSTSLQYRRSAGDYTFHSSGYDRFWTTVTVTDPVTGETNTTTTSGDTPTEDSGTVLQGVFLDAFQTLQVNATATFGGTSIGGWTQEHAVQMTEVDRTWDDTTESPGQVIRLWGYERRTYWDASGSGVTTP